MNSLKTTILLASLTGLLVLAGNMVGGTNGMMIMLVISLGMNFFSYWYSDKLVLKMYGAKIVTAEDAPDLVRMVANLAKKADMPMPKVCIMETNVPNAFATGRNPENGVVAVTTGIMRTLNYQELEGVVAHELSHIKNRDTLISTVAASIAGLITMIATMAKWGAILGGRDSNNSMGGMVGFLFLIILAPLAATIIQLAVSRSREYGADATGGRISGNPLALANALRKIEASAKQAVMPNATPATSSLFIINPLSGSAASAMSSLFSTHPATDSRIKKLEELAQQMK
jgi:heat shock protein HtpX